MPVESNVHALWGAIQPYANAKQTISSTATGGTFKLTLDGRQTDTIAFNATAAVVKTALAALSNIDTADLTVTGGPLPTGVVVEFVGSWASEPVATMTVDNTAATGGTVTVAATQVGASGKGGAPLATHIEVQRLLMVGGDFQTNRDDGAENYSDLDRFGSQWDYVNTILGQGSPVIEAQADQVAWLLYAFLGGEVYTAKVANTSPPKYVFEPSQNVGAFFTTFWKRVGATDVLREKFGDCLVTGMRIEGSTANKIVKITPTLLSLDPGVVYDANGEPTAPVNLTQAPFVYTEASGAFMLDGAVYRGQSQFALVMDDNRTPTYGDSVTPFEIVTGNAAMTLEGVTIQLDKQGLTRYYQQIYGTGTPDPGTKPLSSIPAWGSYQATFTRTAANPADTVSLKIECPKVKWSPDLAIPPNPDGGAIELAFAGGIRKQAVAPKSVRITVETGAGRDAAHTFAAAS